MRLAADIARTHDRPYKRAWPFDQALSEVRRLRGRQFDPHVEDAFEAVAAFLYDPTHVH